MESAVITPVTARPSSGRFYFWMGLALGLLGPLLYFLQMQAQYLSVPWYVPILGTVAAASVLLAALRTQGWWRLAPIVLFVLLGFLAFGEWHFLLVDSKVPAYTGPVEVGKPFPAFTTTLADGSKFDQTSLKDEQATVMVFFRGRW
jgi:hypothetical protein